MARVDWHNVKRGPVPKGYEDAKVNTEGMAPIEIGRVNYIKTQFKNFRVEHAFTRGKLMVNVYHIRMDKALELAGKYLYSHIYPFEPEEIPEMRCLSLIYRADVPAIFLDWLTKQLNEVDKLLTNL